MSSPLEMSSERCLGELSAGIAEFCHGGNEGFQPGRGKRSHR